MQRGHRLFPALSYTTRSPECGRTLVQWPPFGINIQRACYPMGRCSLRAMHGYLTSTELYDPGQPESGSLPGHITAARFNHTATVLPSGKVLASEGMSPDSGGYFSSAELYDLGLGYTNSWQPQIAAITSPLNLGGSLVVTGSLFRGVSGGSGGNSQDSSTDYPLVQLRSLESGQTMFLLTTNWSTNSFTSLPVGISRPAMRWRRCSSTAFKAPAASLISAFRCRPSPL